MDSDFSCWVDGLGWELKQHVWSLQLFINGGSHFSPNSKLLSRVWVEFGPSRLVPKVQFDCKKLKKYCLKNLKTSCQKSYHWNTSNANLQKNILDLEFWAFEWLFNSFANPNAFWNSMSQTENSERQGITGIWNSQTEWTSTTNYLWPPEGMPFLTIVLIIWYRTVHEHEPFTMESTKLKALMVEQ